MSNPRFPISDKMPCDIADLSIPRYRLPMPFGKAEKEEAVARLIIAMQEKGRWTGITWRELVTQMKAEADIRKADYDALETYYSQLRERESDRRWYVLWCIATLGLYYFCTTQPDLPQKPKLSNLPLTGIFLTGTHFVSDGLHGLITDGLIRQKTIGDGKEAESVFYVTPKLIEVVIALCKRS